VKFSDQLEQRLERMLKNYPVKRSVLVPMLLYVQDELGYLSDEAMRELGQRLDLSELEVRNVASYYSMLRFKPMGRYHVQVCTNISCMLRGAEEVFDRCRARLGIGHKQTTPDGVFSLEEVECIGACSWAPAVQVNYAYHEKLTPEAIDQVLEDYRQKAEKNG
jgi:NADH-quinone oxidoreductase subunit E